MPATWGYPGDRPHSRRRTERKSFFVLRTKSGAPRETVRRHMGRLVALGLIERAEDQTFVPTEELREVEIERALRLLRQGTAGLL